MNGLEGLNGTRLGSRAKVNFGLTGDSKREQTMCDSSRKAMPGLRSAKANMAVK